MLGHKTFSHSKEDLLRIIDHTNLNPNATEAQINQLCDEAIRYGFGAVCVAPSRVAVVADMLARAGGSDIAIASVVGFPHGNTLTKVKEFETKEVIAQGATEIDMVMAIGQFGSGDYDTVQSDINKVVKVAEKDGIVVKVILETYLLGEETKIRKACQLAVDAGAAFVKTSTGFSISEKNDPDAIDKKLRAVKIMVDEVSAGIGVKAAGGISNLLTALKFRKAGATRLGCSSSVEIAKELAADSADK